MEAPAVISLLTSPLSLAHWLLYRQVVVQTSKPHCSAVDWPCVLSMSQNTQQKQLTWEQIISLAHRLGDKVHRSGEGVVPGWGQFMAAGSCSGFLNGCEWEEVVVGTESNKLQLSRSGSSGKYSLLRLHFLKVPHPPHTVPLSNGQVFKHINQDTAFKSKL